MWLPDFGRDPKTWFPRRLHPCGAPSALQDITVDLVGPELVAPRPTPMPNDLLGFAVKTSVSRRAGAPQYVDSELCRHRNSGYV